LQRITLSLADPLWLLTGDSAADAITKATRRKFGRIDLLVNNAGIGPGASGPIAAARPQILGDFA
jgi:NAD(P)-dependent dehydrogenase (short-subunit alcohol dehydrogenase family)